MGPVHWTFDVCGSAAQNAAAGTLTQRLVTLENHIPTMSGILTAVGVLKVNRKLQKFKRFVFRPFACFALRFVGYGINANFHSHIRSGSPLDSFGTRRADLSDC